MNYKKTLFLAIFGLFVAWGVKAQVVEEAFAKTDPVKAVQLFPNPATEYVSVKFELPHAKKSKLELYTIIGNTLDVESEVIDDYEIRVKVKDLPSGYYLLAVRDEEAHAKSTHKFLKR